MTGKKKSLMIDSIEKAMEPTEQTTNLSEIKNQSVSWPRLEPEDIPTVFINEKQIELTEIEAFNVPSLMDRFSWTRNELPSKGYFNAFHQDAFQSTRKSNKWFYALVNNVKIYISLGSKIKLKTIEPSYSDSELDLADRNNNNVLILNGGIIEGESLYINNLVDFYNSLCKIEKTLDLSKACVYSSTLEIGSGYIKNSTIFSSSIIGNHISINENECKESSINVKGGITILKSNLNKFRFGNWSKGGVSLNINNVSIWDFNINARSPGVYTVKHRSHYGVIQGIDSNEFMLVTTNDRCSEIVGMYIKNRIVTSADLKNDDRFKSAFQPAPESFSYQPNLPTIVPENNIQKFIFSLFNNQYTPNLSSNSFMHQSIWSQYDHIKAQIESRLNLWELMESLK